MDDWRKQIIEHKYSERQKPPVYKQPAPAEMKAITDTILSCRKQGDTYKTLIGKCVAAWTEEFKQARAKAPAGDQRGVRRAG